MAVPSIVTFADSDLFDVGSHAVFWRENWTDPWTEEISLQCVECVWNCAPALPTATIVWRYGNVKQPFTGGFTEVLKRRDLRRVFIKIVIVSNDVTNTFKWHGVLEINDDHMEGARLIHEADGTVTVKANGQQSFTCYGMSKLLADHDVVTSVWGKDIPPETVYTIDRPLTFNKDGVGNMTAATIVDTNVFEPDKTTGSFWSTEDIVKYLARHQTPRDETGAVVVEFQLLAGGTLPDWDREIVECDNSTTHSILDRLISRKRMLVWWVFVDDDTDIVYIATNSLLQDTVALTPAWASPLKANINQLHVIFDQDQRTTGVLRDNGTDVVDQVVATGGFRRSICTLAFDDSNLTWNYSDDSTVAYQDGASNHLDYASWSPAEQQRRNKEARQVPFVRQVYANFIIPYDWDAKSRDGVGGGDDATWYDVFIDDAGEAYPVFVRDLVIESSLPILSGYDYSAGLVGSGGTGETTYDREHLSPIVAFLRPDVTRWVLAENINSGSDIESDNPLANPDFSCSVRVSDDERGLIIRVHGGDHGQHAIANATNFSALAEDIPLTGYDFDEAMLVTVAIRDDRKVEAKSPADAAVVAGDVIRRLYIDCGDGYRKDYIVPSTVVGIDDEGALIRSTGGYMPFTGGTPDDERLDAIAEIAAAYYTVPHYTLVIETYQPTIDIWLGDLIQQIGNTEAPEATAHRLTINSPVTQIKLTLPDDGGPVVQTFTTWAGELDPMQLRPVLTEFEAGKRAKYSEVKKRGLYKRIEERRTRESDPTMS